LIFLETNFLKLIFFGSQTTRSTEASEAYLKMSLLLHRRTTSLPVAPHQQNSGSVNVTIAAAMAESPLLYTNDENDDDDDGTIEPTATAVVESPLLAPAVASTQMVIFKK
jgi:hypothetical protein